MAKDYYSILGVPKNANQEEIKKAFRKLAHEFHPDKQGGNAEKFKEANEAYSVLSDEKKRAQYDSFGSAPGGGGFNANDFSGFDFSGFTQGANGFEFDLGDIFGDIFGGGNRQKTPRGSDIAVDLELNFRESIFGIEKEIAVAKTSTCDTCNGSGAKKGSTIETCTTCNGKGNVREVRRSIIGSFSTVRTCEVCSGTGKIPKEKCDTCRGKGVVHKTSNIKASIPAGIEDGEVIRLSGMGEAIRGGNSGDLYLRIRVRGQKGMKKEGQNIVMNHSIKISDSVLGARQKIETLDGIQDLEIPEGTQFGDILKIKGKGVPYANNKRGDLLVKIHIEIPKKVSKDVKKLMDGLRQNGV